LRNPSSRSIAYGIISIFVITMILIIKLDSVIVKEDTRCTLK
jgi:hypothetical protein